MTRPSHITCSCGQTRPVPVHGAIPRKCIECQRNSIRQRNRKRMLTYSRREDIKERRRRDEGRTRRYRSYGPRVTEDHDNGSSKNKTS